MKKLALIALICIALSCTSKTVYAQDTGFGIGAMINGPTGISYKAWINEDMALAGGLTFNISSASSFYLHTDFLMHGKSDNSEINLESGLMRLYYGGGVSISYNDLTNNTDVGIRFPLGTTYEFENAPVDIFFELAPTILFNDFDFGFNGALGFRYYLN